MLTHTQAIVHAPPPDLADGAYSIDADQDDRENAPREDVKPALKLQAFLQGLGPRSRGEAGSTATHWATLRTMLPDTPSPAALGEPTEPVQIDASLSLPATFAPYGRIDRADAGQSTAKHLLITAAEIGAKRQDRDGADGADSGKLSIARLPTGKAENADSFAHNNSLSEISSAIQKAWRTTRHYFQRRWARHATTESPERAESAESDSPAKPADTLAGPQRLTFDRLGGAIKGMSALFLLHAVSAVPLVLAIFRWPADQAHDSCKPPAPQQQPEWITLALQSVMTGVALLGSGLYVGQVLRRHWNRLSPGGKILATSGATALVGLSGLLTFYDKTLTMGRMLAGFIDKYLEILVTNGWTTEVGPGAGDGRTLTAWGAIITISLFALHMIRSALFVGVDFMLNQKQLSAFAEILLRAGGKVVSEILAFGALMPSAMALSNNLFNTRFIVRQPSRSIRQSASNTASRCAKAVTGEASRMQFCRDLGRNMIRPFRKREFSTKFVNLPSLGHNTVCAGGQGNMSVDLWFRNAFGESILEMIKAGETLRHARQAADTTHQGNENASRAISLVGDYLRADALPSERLRDEVGGNAESTSAAER